MSNESIWGVFGFFNKLIDAFDSLFVVVPILFGVVILYGFFKERLSVKKIKKYMPVSGKVIAISFSEGIDKSFERISTYYSAEIEYEYFFNDITYKSKNIFPYQTEDSFTTFDKNELSALERDYKSDSEIVVFVNLDDVNDVYLMAKPQDVQPMVMLVVGIVLLLVGFGFVVYG